MVKLDNVTHLLPYQCVTKMFTNKSKDYGIAKTKDSLFFSKFWLLLEKLKSSLGEDDHFVWAL